jgi:diguanylate cyclase (GGDEF)-like protein/PAS domain S-box-containing protein
VDAHGSSPLDADRLVEVLDGVAVLFYVQDTAGRITYANHAACELVGRPPEDVIGRMPAELFDPVTVERWMAQNAEVLRTGRPLDVEDGWDDRTHLTHKTPVFDAEGRPVAVIGLSTDITERKRAEEALRRSRERLADAQQIAGVGSFHWDPVGRAVEWSDELRRILAFTDGSEPVGPETLELVHPDDRPALEAAARAALQEGGALELDLRMVRGDGVERLFHVRAGATLAPDGTPWRLDGICADVTERRRGEERLAQAQRLAEIGSFDRDLETGELTVSPEIYRMLRVDSEHVVPSREVVLGLVAPEDRERLRGEVDAAVRADGDFDCFVGAVRTDGERRELRVRGAVHRGHLIGICQDLTDLRAAERERIEVGERFRSVFERAPVGIALVARGGEVALANEALADLLGRETLAGMRVEDVMHPDDVGQNTDALRRMAAGELAEWNTEARFVRPGGAVRWAAVRALLVHDAEGRSSHCLALVQDISEQRRGERRRAAELSVLREIAAGRELVETLPAIERIVDEELGGEPGEELATLIAAFVVRRTEEEQRLHEALHDPLTGLPNRVLFFDRLDHAMRRQRREHSPLAVLFLDFDGFKAVNDRFGHSGGDQVLQRAAALVASTLRAEDTVARFGGDELVILSEHILGRDHAAGIAQRILDRLRDPIELDGDEVALSASIGICVAPVEGPTREQLLDLADAAMYRAKAAGPGRYVIAD